MRRARVSKPAQAPAVAFNAISQHRKDAELEAWICKRLELRDLFAGVTSRQIRRDRLKVVLLERKLIEAIGGRFEGKSITWRALHKLLYNDDLT